MGYMKNKAIENLNDRRVMFSESIDSISEALETLKDLIGYYDETDSETAEERAERLWMQSHEK